MAELQAILVKLTELELRIGHYESTADSEKDTRKRTTRYLMQEIARVKEKVIEMQRIEAADEILKTQTIQATRELTREVAELKVVVHDLKNESDSRKRLRAIVMVQGAALAAVLIRLIFDYLTHK